MADFTIYNGASEEWLKIEATLPPRLPTEGPIDSIAVRNAGNAAREEASATAFSQISDRLVVKDHTITTRDGFALEARSYRLREVAHTEALPVYLYYHGGGFIFGTLSSEDAACGRVVLSLAARGEDVVVLNVNYRHTPEWKYPVAWDDTVDSFVWLHQNLTEVGGDGSRVIIGGVSAGARLTASLIVRKSLGQLEAGQDLPHPIGQVLIIPSLFHQDCREPLYAKLKDPSRASCVSMTDAPIVPSKVLKWFTEILDVKEAPSEDLKLSPGNITDEQLASVKDKFPPTVIGVAGYDPLRDDGLVFAKGLAEAGIPTKTHVFHGVPHGFRRFGAQLSASKRWDAAIDDGIIWCLSNPSATGEFNVIVE